MVQYLASLTCPRIEQLQTHQDVIVNAGGTRGQVTKAAKQDPLDSQNVHHLQIPQTWLRHGSNGLQLRSTIEFYVIFGVFDGT